MTAAALSGSGGGLARELVAGYRRLAGLLRLVVSERDVEKVLARIAHALGELVPAEDLVVWDCRGEELLPLFVEGADAQALRSVRVGLGEGITGLAALAGEPIFVNDAHRDPRVRLIPGTDRMPAAIVCVPLVAHGRVIGAISLYRSRPEWAFTEQAFELACSFAEVAAVALDNAHAHRELEQLAATDDLTGVANRRRFREELAREFATARRHRQPLSLLLVDLDGFKTVNDDHGHEHGDRLLAAVAILLRRYARESDLVARIGGDEFALLLPQTNKQQAQELARRLRCAIGEHSPSPGITASIGSATLQPDDDAGELLRAADRDLYAKKRQATNRHRRRPTHTLLGANTRVAPGISPFQAR